MYPLVGWKFKDELVFLAEGFASDTGRCMEWVSSIGKWSVTATNIITRTCIHIPGLPSFLEPNRIDQGQVSPKRTIGACFYRRDALYVAHPAMWKGIAHCRSLCCEQDGNTVAQNCVVWYRIWYRSYRIQSRVNHASLSDSGVCLVLNWHHMEIVRNTDADDSQHVFNFRIINYKA